MSKRNNKPSFIDDLVRFWPGLPYLALGVWLAWTWLATSGTFWLSDTEIDGHNISRLYLLSTGVSALLMLSIPFFRRFAEGLFARPAFIWLGALLVSLGSAFIILAGPYYLSEPWLFYVGIVLTGIGAVVLTMKFGQLYGNLTPGKVVTYIVFSQLIVTFIYFVILGAAWFHPIEGGPTLSGILGLVGLPFLAALFATKPRQETRRPGFRQASHRFKFGQETRRAEFGQETRRAEPQPSPTENKGGGAPKSRDPLAALRFAIDGSSPSFWKLCIVILLFSAITSVARGLAIHPAVPLENLINNNVHMILRAACAAILLYFMVKVAKKANFSRMYFTFVAGIAVILMVVASLQFYGSSLMLFSNLALSFFEMMCWCMLAFIAYQRSVSPIVVFGFGYGMFFTGSTVGWILGAWLMPVVSLGSWASFVIIILALLLLVCAILLFFEKDFDQLFPAALEKDSIFSKIMVQDEVKDDLTPENAEPKVEGKENKRANTRPYVEACKRIGNSLLFTKREQEIFEQLALGRELSGIAKRLNIGINTVRSHVRGIYKKLGVHSREELTEFVWNYIEKHEKP